MSIFNSTLVRILGDAHEQQNPAGAGFIASNKHIVTCAHVVGDALGIPREGEAPPDESLWVDLPLLENSKPIEAKALVWHPVRDEVERGELEDIAVLELCPGESFPEEILPAPIIVLDDSAFFDCPVRIYGFPEGMGSGDWLAGHLQGPVSSGWIQLDQQLGQQVAASGFSGTPVWDTQENAIVGIIISTRARDGVTSAYMMPASRLAAAWPDIDAQCRAPNPYRGLQAFHVEHAANFFGRGREIEELLEAVRSNALVSVVGASGSGKSSLVLAGVAAKLQEAPEWLIAEFRPVSDPFEGLASALGPLVYPATDAIEARNRVYKKLTSRVLNIVDLVSVILQENAGKRLLIIVDQFEELYTQNRSSRQQISFLEGLLGTVKGQAQSPACSVLLAIRADFFPQLLSYGPLAEAI
ncbi:MAG: serine protease, partial [Pseudomonadota bacterium]